MSEDREILDVVSHSECESDTELITRNYELTSERREEQQEASSTLLRTVCPCLTKRRSYTISLNSGDGFTEGVNHDSSLAPRDRFHLVYICFFLAGAGFLFPFNSYIAAIDYFFSLYRPQFTAIAEIIPMTYLLVTLCASTLNLSLVERLSINTRIVFGYVMFSVSLFFVPMLDIGINNCTVSTGVSFYLTLASIVVVGLGSGFQQSAYYGVSSMLPPRYSQALLAGESVAGFVVALNRIFTKLIFNSERVGAIVFFVASLLFVLLCVGCYVYIRKSRFVKYHTMKCRKKTVTEDATEQEMVVVGEFPSESPSRDEDGSSKENEEVVDQPNKLLIPTQHASLRTKIIGAIRLRLVVISQIWRLMVAIFVNYVITLLIFPGLLSEIRYDPIGDWAPVILITIFNLTDFIAKWAALIKIRWTSTRLMLVGFLRLILIPLVILCVTPSPCNPVLVAGVIGWAVVFTSALGLSNGYFGSLPMINVSSEVKREKDRELAGSIMIWTLLLGLSVGSVLAYSLTPLTKLDQSCTSNTTGPIVFSCYGNNTF